MKNACEKWGVNFLCCKSCENKCEIRVNFFVFEPCENKCEIYPLKCLNSLKTSFSQTVSPLKFNLMFHLLSSFAIIKVSLPKLSIFDLKFTVC